MIVNFTIKQLKEVEKSLEETIDVLAESEIEMLDLRGKLEEIQTAILAISAIQEFFNVEKLQDLKEHLKSNIIT